MGRTAATFAIAPEVVRSQMPGGDPIDHSRVGWGREYGHVHVAPREGGRAAVAGSGDGLKSTFGSAHGAGVLCLSGPEQVDVAGELSRAVETIRTSSLTVVIGLAPVQAATAFPRASGSTVWVRRYNRPVHGQDQASGVAASPDGSKVFVIGSSQTCTGRQHHYETIACAASDGRLPWMAAYNGVGSAPDRPFAIDAGPDGSKSSRRE